MSAYLQHKTINRLQSALMIFALATICGAIAWLLGGAPLAIYVMVVIVFIYRLNPVASPELAMRLFRAKALEPREAPTLSALIEDLAGQAGLETPPRLYYIPSDVMNAFTIGTPQNSAIALSDGLLRRLQWRELRVVLAHELMHIVNQDTHLMSFADLASRLTAFLSITGQLMLLINLPLMILGEETIPWLPILLLIIAPSISTLAQLALSRTREFQADLGAAKLTGDPLGLASALNKINPPRQGILERLFHPGPRIPEPSVLRTHPPTQERIERLMELADSEQQIEPATIDLSHLLATRPYRPRWHRNGMWY